MAPEHPLVPVSLVLTGRSCLLVGGREVALGRARQLLDAGAELTVVATEVTDELRSLVEDRAGHVATRAYSPGEAAHYFLVVAATGDAEVNAAVLADADRAGTFVNAVDDLEHSSVHFPAVFRAGPVSVAVSSSASSPALARWLRDRIGEEHGADAAALAALLAPVRSALRGAGHSSEGRDWFGLIDALRRALHTGEDAAQVAASWLKSELDRSNGESPRGASETETGE